jgi:hypothetical protein
MTHTYITCSSCGARLRGPEGLIGKPIQCPRCHGLVTATPSSKLPAAVNLVEVQEDQTKECPFCGESVRAVAKKCKHCGETIDVVLRTAEEARRAAQQPTQVFMNAGGGGAAASSSAAASSTSGHRRGFLSRLTGCLTALMVTLMVIIVLVTVLTIVIVASVSR